MVSYAETSVRRGARRPDARRWSLAGLAAAAVLGASNGASSQAAPGDWTGQSLSTTLTVPGGPTYNQVFQQSYASEAGPTCVTPASSVLQFSVCSPAQIAAGDITEATDLQFRLSGSPVSSVPAGASAPGTTAVVNVGGEYVDSSSPTGVSFINAFVPLNAFATASSVSAETSRATTAEAVLGSNIASEISRAETAESTLGSEIQAEAAARVADIARVNRGYRMAVATAIALGGMGVIPGKRLNLTLNMGTYEGQWAVAAQGAYVVSDHAMLNAGISTSASGAGTGARAGVTLGW